MLDGTLLRAMIDNGFASALTLAVIVSIINMCVG